MNFSYILFLIFFISNFQYLINIRRKRNLSRASHGDYLVLIYSSHPLLFTPGTSKLSYEGGKLADERKVYPVILIDLHFNCDVELDVSGEKQLRVFILDLESETCAL